MPFKGGDYLSLQLLYFTLQFLFKLIYYSTVLYYNYNTIIIIIILLKFAI